MYEEKYRIGHKWQLWQVKEMTSLWERKEVVRCVMLIRLISMCNAGTVLHRSSKTSVLVLLNCVRNVWLSFPCYRFTVAILLPSYTVFVLHSMLFHKVEVVFDSQAADGNERTKWPNQDSWQLFLSKALGVNFAVHVISEKGSLRRGFTMIICVPNTQGCDTQYKTKYL